MKMSGFKKVLPDDFETVKVSYDELKCLHTKARDFSEMDDACIELTSHLLMLIADGANAVEVKWQIEPDGQGRFVTWGKRRTR